VFSRPLPQARATQSSTALTVANLATDGSTNPLLDEGSVSSTLPEDNPWWQLQLPRGTTVRSINIWPRLPEAFIHPVVTYTLRTLGGIELPTGTMRIKVSNVNAYNASIAYVTDYIALDATPVQIQAAFAKLSMLGEVDVTKQTMQRCYDGCGVGGPPQGFGYIYTITFLECPTRTPQVVLQDFTPPPQGWPGKIERKVSLTRPGSYVPITPNVYGVGVNHSFNARIDAQMAAAATPDQYLAPYYVMLFADPTQPPPNDIGTSLNQALWVGYYTTVTGVNQIILPQNFTVGYIKVQRSGFGVLSLAEVEVFSGKINTIGAYQTGSGPVPPSVLTDPYQTPMPLSLSFANYPVDGRWTVKISQDTTSRAINADGTGGAYGTVGDAVLVVTDWAGYVRTYYQDLAAVVTTTPKYGSLHATARWRDLHDDLDRHGDWFDAFQVAVDGSSMVLPAPGGGRPEGVCYGIDNVGITGYWYCPQSYGVPPTTSDYRYLGDKASVMRLYNERVVAYQPYPGYVGPDYFTYLIYDGLNLQTHQIQGATGTSQALGGGVGDLTPTPKTADVVVGSLNEVTVNVRDCRLVNAKTRLNIREAVHPLCVCAELADGSSLLGNYTRCDLARTQLCDSLANPVHPDGYYLTGNPSVKKITRPDPKQRQFVAMCQACAPTLTGPLADIAAIRSDPMRGKRGECLAQTMRAVFTLNNTGLCSPLPHLDCSTETYTHPGFETHNLLSLNSPLASGYFTALGNSFGGEGLGESAPVP